jgi:hypothetical protein
METDSSQSFCDNKSAIMLASDSVMHERSKHIGGYSLYSGKCLV